MDMEKTLNEIWNDWVIVRETFTKKNGVQDLEFGGYYIPKDSELYRYYINMGMEQFQVPNHIAEANLRVLGKAKKELVGYSYDRNFKVPCDRLLEGAVIEFYKYSGHDLNLFKSKFVEGTPIKIVEY